MSIRCTHMLKVEEYPKPFSTCSQLTLISATHMNLWTKPGPAQSAWDIHCPTPPQVAPRRPGCCLQAVGERPRVWPSSWCWHDYSKSRRAAAAAAELAEGQQVKLWVSKEKKLTLALVGVSSSGSVPFAIPAIVHAGLAIRSSSVMLA